MIVELENPSSKVWNGTLEKAGSNGTIFQSTFWADYFKKTYGDRPIYLANVDKRGDILGLLLGIESCYAKHPALTQLGKRGMLFGKFYRYSAKWLLQRALPFVFWQTGPVVLQPPKKCATSFDKRNVCRELIDGIIERSVNRGCYEVKFARPPYFDDASDIFSSAGFKKRRMGTILTNLECTSDELFKSIHHGCRRYIRRGIKNGIEVSEVSNLVELRQFYDLNVEHSKRSGIKVYPYSHFTSLWDHFLPIRKLVIFIASQKDTPLSGLLCLMHNRTIHAFRIGESYYSRTNRLYPTYPLWWHAIQWAQEQGFKYFDWMGVEQYKIDAGYKKALTIYRFKKNWGQLVEFHDYDKTFYESRLVKFLNRFMADTL